MSVNRSITTATTCGREGKVSLARVSAWDPRSKCWTEKQEARPCEET